MLSHSNAWCSAISDKNVLFHSQKAKVVTGCDASRFTRAGHVRQDPVKRFQKLMKDG